MKFDVSGQVLAQFADERDGYILSYLTAQIGPLTAYPLIAINYSKDGE